MFGENENLFHVDKFVILEAVHQQYASIQSLHENKFLLQQNTCDNGFL